MATRTKAPTLKTLREQRRYHEEVLAIEEVKYTTQLLKEVQRYDNAVEDPDRASWTMISSSSHLSANKDLGADPIQGLQHLREVRKESYRAWRLNPHARGILRNLVKYVVGREFHMDFADTQHGTWNADKTAVTVTNKESDPFVVRLIWDDFDTRNKWAQQRAKEVALRTFRDGDCFIRRFRRPTGRVDIRFIEPNLVDTPPDRLGGSGIVQPEDTVVAMGLAEVGEKTRTLDGIEVLQRDVETVVAYHVRPPGTLTASIVFERVQPDDVIHLKCLADSNDIRGFPILEVILRNLRNVQDWEHYRLMLNKVRTAVTLVRKIESATASQAAALIAGRQPARTSPAGREPQTTSGRQEVMFRPGTILTPGPGVSYEFTAPRLEARDAGEDGRRFLMSAAAGAGMPEMLISGDWSNSNFASSREAMEAALREWWDWQDFFSPPFEQVFRWVVEAASGMDGRPGSLGLPASSNLDVTLRFPEARRTDPEKETARRETLNIAGILSKQTWAGQEGLDYDQEIENIRLEVEAGESPSGDDTDDDDRETNAEGRVRRAHAALAALGELEEAIVSMPSTVQSFVQRYVDTTRGLILGTTPVTTPKKTRKKKVTA